MKNWPTEIIGKVCEVLDYKRRPISKVDRVAGPYPYYGATGVQDHIADYLFDEPLILIGEDGAKWGSCQTCAFRVEGKFWVNNHAHVLKPNRNVISDSWLVNYLNYADLNEFVSGATVQKLNQANLREIEIPLPDIKTQHRIAAGLDEQLSTIDEARAAAERRVAAAEALEAALFREFFHGLSPVMIGLPKDAAPAGWKWTRLLGLADLESGHTPSRRHPEWWGGDIPWLALPDIRALDGKVVMETKENTNKLGIANSSARILPKDTVALSRTASVGFVAIFGRSMATSQDFVNWICGKDLSPRFLLHALRASREHFLANASGAIHKTLYMPAVKDFHLCHPTRKAQETLAATLDTRLADASTLLSAAHAELVAIRALPAAALRRVFGNEARS